MPRAEVVDDSSFRRGMTQLRKRMSKDVLANVVGRIGGDLLNKSASVVPYGYTGDLLASRFLRVIKVKLEARFGYNTKYARFQDAPGQSGTIIVRPRRKRYLYIPISEAGRELYVYNFKPQNRGLVYNVDYVLRKFVKVPIRPYGSRLGPNHYLSGTVQKHGNGSVRLMGLLLWRQIVR